MTRVSMETRESARRALRNDLQPGDTLYTVLEHVSASGMTRDIGVYAIRDNKPVWLSGVVADALELPRNRKRNGIRVGGAGMDMGYWLVSTLARRLWPDGFECIGKGCPSNDHSNGDRDYTPHTHTSGDYALRQGWL